MLSERLKNLDQQMSAAVTRGEVPGLVTLVSRAGEVQINAYGTRSLNGSDPVTRNTIFRITSMTKPITAIATLMLIEEGKLKLDEPVDRLLPELANRQVLKQLNSPLTDTVPAKRAITVRDLLTFGAGYGLIMGSASDYPILAAVEAAGLVGFGAPDPASPLTPDEWLSGLGKLPLMHQPGDDWRYNTGSYILGVLIARASGLSLENFFRQRIFNPLGMKDTSFCVSSQQMPRLSGCYYFDSEANKLEIADPIEESAWRNPPAFPDGGAGLVSTIDDYFTFAQMMMDGGNGLISKSSIELMTTDHLTAAQKADSEIYPGQWDQSGYGMGVLVTSKGQYGWDGGFGSSWRNDPRHRTIGIILTERTFDSPKFPPVIENFWNELNALNA